MSASRSKSIAEGVTVAIPVRDGTRTLTATLDALSRQTIQHELLICDSGSRDRSIELARRYGARVLQIAASQFSHGGTRNLLMAEASGAHVAFLTQDAEPVDAHWLERMLGAFDLAPDVGIVYGPYQPRPEATPAVRMELERWFASLSPGDQPMIERLVPEERSLPAMALIGRRGFFTDVNACVARSSWEQVPFREVPYAEDRVLAIDMLRAGYAKAYLPAASVWHSHNYTTIQHLRRCFDEWRGLREVYGWREPASPVHLARSLRGELGRSRRELEHSGISSLQSAVMLAGIARHHTVRSVGAMLGSRSDRLPVALRRVLSLEGRAGFSPLELDQPLSPV